MAVGKQLWASALEALVRKRWPCMGFVSPSDDARCAYLTGDSLIGSTSVVGAAETSLGLAQNTLATPADLGAAQFGTNIFMNNPAGGASQNAQVSIAVSPKMRAAGVCTPVELNTYMNDVDDGPFALGRQLSSFLAAQNIAFEGFQMSFAQASAFLKRFTSTAEKIQQPNYIVVLSTLVETYLTAVRSGDSTTAAGAGEAFAAQMSKLGFNLTFGTLRVKSLTSPNSVFDLPPPARDPIIAMAYVSYLVVYLPEKFFVGCSLVGSPLRADGARLCRHT